MSEHAALQPAFRAGVLPWVGRHLHVAAGTSNVRRRRAALTALLLGTAFLYLWGLGASGWANGYYSAAVEAGTKSWKAFLFGSFDASNFVTVDKPPASLWLMELSARLFGVNAWSILVPQALEGVAAVAVLYATVRRRFGHGAGLIAGAVLAATPVAALIFRFNNPDALLVLLLVTAVYAMTRALESGATRWLVLAGTLVGFGFLTKMLQAFIVLPVFFGVYLLAARVPLRRRLVQVVLASAAVLLSAGWWVALVSLWPAADRPHIGGSTDDSMLNLIFGYNGFGRITGDETGSVGGGPSGWGPTGWDRMFNASYGGQISWLIPAALIAFGAVLVSRRKAPRTDGRRAAALLWGGWLLLTGAVFSFAQGIIHEYYSVALAPAVGALVGMGAAELWPRRDSVWSRCSLAAAVAASAAWAYVLLGRSPGWLPWLGGAVVACGAISSLALVALPVVRRRLSAGAGALALATILAAPVAYSVDTALTPHTGALPLAGPARLAALAGGPIGRGFRGNGAFAGPPPFARGALPMPGGVLAPANGLGRTAAGPRGSSGGLLEASDPRPALIKALQQHAARYSWVAATVGANSAAGYQLASGDPVMAIGGFNGTDPTPTLSEFERLVGQGRIHYFVAGGAAGRGPVPGGSASTQAIITWVEQSFTPTTIGGTTVYDLSRLS